MQFNGLTVTFVCFVALSMVVGAFGGLDSLFPGGWADTASMARDFVVAFVGVFFALQFDQLSKTWFDGARRIELLESLKASFENNLKLLNLMLANHLTLPIPESPSFPPDIGSLDGLRSERQELLNDRLLKATIDHAEFELIHVNRKLELLISHFNLPNLNGTIALVQSTIGDCDKVVKQIDEALRKTPRSMRVCKCHPNRP